MNGDRRAIFSHDIGISSRSKELSDSINVDLDDENDETTDCFKARMKLLTAQNEEMLRLIESEEAHNARLASESESMRDQLLQITEKFKILEESSRLNADVVKETSKERLLHVDEIRLLRAEIDRLKTQSNEENMKKSVEIDSLEEHLRVLKTKQYQLLGKLQRLEEARKHAEDQVTELEEKIEKDHAKSSSLDLQLQLESQSRINQEELAKKLQTDNDTLTHENRELSLRLHKLSQDQIKSEVDLAESSDQLRAMAEKVFQLLERLKLAELARSKTMEAMQVKEQETSEWQKKHAHLIKESCAETAAREHLEAEKKTLEEQVRTLKRQNMQLGQRCKEEAKGKVQVEDDYKVLEEKNNALSSKLSFLLNRLQIEEAEDGVRKEHMTKLQKEQESLLDRNEILQEKLHLAEESIRELSIDLLKKAEELQMFQTKYDALSLMIQEQDELKEESDAREKVRNQHDETGVILAEGRLRFFIEYNKQTGMLAMRGKNSKDRQWLENNKCNLFLRKAIRSNNMEETLLHKLAELYGVIATHEDEVVSMQDLTKKQEAEIESMRIKLNAAVQKMGFEEESKVNLLVKYVNEIKNSTQLSIQSNPIFDGAKMNLSRVRFNLSNSSIF